VDIVTLFITVFVGREKYWSGLHKKEYLEWTVLEYVCKYTHAAGTQ